jgi:hypothetical protein
VIEEIVRNKMKEEGKKEGRKKIQNAKLGTN